MKPIEININGHLISAHVQKIKKDLWVHFFGKTIKLSFSDLENSTRGRRRSGRGSEGGGSSDRVVAPMPGKIIKILVNKDQLISAGDTVLVMEAMKMEYTLKAEISAKVAKINCQVGDQVQLGAELVHFVVD
jgi:acetyl/propionyl-CoA carboxylase alpha subunit